MTLIRSNFLAASALLGSVVATSAAAVPVQYGANGHYYMHVAGTFTWTEALADAQTMTHLGLQGYLATITDGGENTFIQGLGQDGWIGGTDQATEGVWRWASGPEAGINFWNGDGSGSSPTYANWGALEPNNAGGEDHAVFRTTNADWNDLGDFGFGHGYFVEFSPATPTPEPLVVSVAVAGLAGICWIRRRRDRAPTPQRH